MQSLFDRVVKQTGLAAIIARGIVMRACIRANVKDPERMTRLDLVRALPDIERMLALYLSAEEVSEKIRYISNMAKSQSGGYLIDLTDPRLDD